MNKKQLIQALAEKTGATQKDTAKMIDALLEVTADELANGGAIQITGFGSLESKVRNERKGCNPRTGESIIIPASTTAVFRPGSALQAKLDTKN